MASHELTPEIVDRRLKALSELYELGMSLKSAQILGSVEKLRNDRADPAPRDRPGKVGST